MIASSPDDLRTIWALVVALAASGFWTAAILQAALGDAGQSAWSRASSVATALASSVMLAQIAYVFSCSTCHQ